MTVLTAMVRLLALALPDVLILGGIGLVLAGVYLLLGLAVMLILAGVLAAGYGAALELRTIRQGPRR